MIVDSHAHVFRTPLQGRRQKSDYVIDEYGALDVELIEEDGTLDDLLMHMRRAGVDRVFVLNLFAVRPGPQEGTVRAFYPGNDAGSPLMMDIDAARDAMCELNMWCVGLAAEAPGLVPFIALDPTLLRGDALAVHLGACIDAGAKGVKLHSLTQGFHASDERLWAAYEVLADAGLPVVAHSGSGKGPRGADAVPSAFSAVAAAFPTLKLVVAHLGGGAWRETVPFAAAHPHVWFDCCEIIQWFGASNAPTPSEMANMIRAIGADRVMLGSDFPWYALDDVVNRVMALPGLSAEEREMILGANAVRILPA